MSDRDSAQDFIKSQIEATKTILAKFKSDFEENPTYAFEWGYSAVRAAAKLRLCLSVAHMLEKGLGLEKVQLMLVQEFHHPDLLNSTNPLSNLVSVAAHEEAIKLWVDIRERAAFWK